MVGTKGKFSQTYGRFEVRAKWPTADTSGIHGGFWMYPVENVYGRWPESGEIDVAEWWSSRPRLSLPSLHFDGRDKEVDSGWRLQGQDTHPVPPLHRGLAEADHALLDRRQGVLRAPLEAGGTRRRSRSRSTTRSA